MSMIQPQAHPVTFACAQAGCAECTDALVRRHQNLVHTILRRQSRNGLPYEDLLQEGLLGLWQAILHFDPQRGYTFSTYAGTAIARRIWLAVARMSRPQGPWLPDEPPDPAEQAIAAWQAAHLHMVLGQALDRLPWRLRQVLAAHYGLDGQAPQTLTAIGRRLHLTCERVRQLRDEALALLRLPAFSGRLRLLGDQNDRAAYARARALHRAWLRSRRRQR